MRRRLFIIAVLVAGVGVYWAASPSGAAVPVAPKPKPINFNRDIRPILSENCYYCHGPDHNHRKGGLRLDQKDSATKPLKSGDTAVVPGDLTHSELIARVTTDDADDHMPPPDSGKKLSPQQIELLKRWVKGGAEFDGLWSFATLKPPEVPEVKNRAWVRNPIDAFVLERLEQEGLTPAPEADRATLIRRLSFDLTGLPPTPAEVDAFVKDSSPDAYEKLVDRLLASPHYGERMALEWLDAARFADTHGYHIDSGRDMTAWRDWVINAFNTNERFDQFTVEQIAGDLLPNATLQQKIASGFQRNAMTNFEGGAVPEEYLSAYQIDRVNTLGSVWLGLTIGCCQCHDHKFDPLTQKDFYSLYAFFNTIAEKGLDGSHGNAEPLLPVPTADQQKKLDALTARMADLEKKLDGPDAAVDAKQVAWERAGLEAEQRHVDWKVCQVSSASSNEGVAFKPLADGVLQATGPNPPTDVYVLTLAMPAGPVTALKVEALPDDALNGHGPGRSENGNFVLTGVKVQASGKPVKVNGVSADFSQDTFPASAVLANKATGGWAIFPQMGKSHEIIFQLDQPIERPSLVLSLFFKAKFAQHTIGKLRVSATSSPDPRGAAKPSREVAEIVKVPAEKRTAEQSTTLRKWYRTYASAETQPIIEELTKAKADLSAVQAGVKTTQVMREMTKPRDTFILVRGMYDKHGEKVTPNTPATLPPMAAASPKNRLGLAYWMVAPNQPLTARVIVNRYWQMYFGNGFVKTANDFGMQGEFPTHPELLDWLASQFVSSGWDVKAMQKLIVMSATYRQSSTATPELVGRDPENRLLAHGPRFRLDAEFIRDQALAASGLLNPEIGGKSVLPYQPAGLWEELMARSDGDNFTAQKYVQDHGKDLYRRGLYTFRKRTSPPPELTVFDAPDREVCTVKRSRTNTPLQALELMNDPTFVEASRHLAAKAMTEGGVTTEQRIDYVFKMLTAREPKPAEMDVLKGVLAQEHDLYAADPGAAAKLLSIGESPGSKSLDKVDHAAWTMLCSTIMNLDESVTKN